jgi:hypothetical protein
LKLLSLYWSYTSATSSKLAAKRTSRATLDRYISFDVDLQVLPDWKVRNEIDCQLRVLAQSKQHAKATLLV